MARPRITLERRAVVARLMGARGDALVVTGLGSTTWDVAAAGDHDLNFYTWGGMGSAAMIGLGLAMAQPRRRVLVVTGDGEMLMGLGALATIGVQRPRNLAVAVIDNERYGETGRQRTHTSHGVDLAGMALAARFRHAETVYRVRDLEEATVRAYRAPGPVLLVIKVRPDADDLVMPERDGTILKARFRRALLGVAG